MFISCFESRGVKPVFCDVDKDSWNMRLEDVEKVVTPKTKAVFDGAYLWPYSRSRRNS